MGTRLKNNSFLLKEVIHMNKQQINKKGNSYYLKILSKNKVLFIFTMLCNITAAGAGVFVAVLLSKIIDYATAGDLPGFKKVLLITFIYITIHAGIYYLYSLLSKKFLRNVMKNLRLKIFNGIFRRNYQTFYQVNSADYISVLTNDMKLIEENYIIPLFALTEYLVEFIVTLVLLLNLSPLITLTLFIGMILMFTIPGALGKHLQSKQEELSNQYSIFTAKMKDIFSGFEVIQSFQLLSDIRKDFNFQNTETATKKYNSDKIFIINNSVSQLLASLLQIVTIFIGAYMVMSKDMTVGTLIAVIQLSGTFVRPLVMIMQNFPMIQSVSPIMKRLEEMGEYQIHELKESLKHPKFEDKISVSNLSFSYNEEQPILQEVSLDINKGKKYAIVGESGCGKSTLTKLLLGYYTNYTGNICYDDRNLADCETEKISEIASVIHQNVYMFDKTIKDNIYLYHEYPDESVNKALEISGVSKFLPETEAGLNTMVGENGSNLSGGQKQRIAIARALVKGSPVLILDEGTSAIDLQTSNDIEQRLLMTADLTLLTITHKLNRQILELYDEIIFMEHGKIADIGTYQELYDAKGGFYEFCRG